MPKGFQQRDNRSQTPTPNHGPKDLEGPIILPISKHDRIYRKWPKILREIVHHMERSGVCLITCVQRGNTSTPKESKTTVLVVCNSSRPPTHREKTTYHIRRLLRENNLWDVGVEFVKGDIFRCGGLMRKELDRRAIQLPCMIGESLGMENAYSSGTLGGLLELKIPGQADYITVGLTCFHILNPSEKGLDPAFRDRVRLWRKEGIKPEDSMRHRIQVLHPSASAIKDKVEALGEEIRPIEQDEAFARYRRLESEGLEDQLGCRAVQRFSRMARTLSELKGFRSDIERFQQSRREYFGPVYAASGFRTTASSNGKPPSSLDWALIEIPHDRIGENTTPDGHYLKDSPVPADIEGLPLFIHGQRSGYCKGIKSPADAAKLDYEIVDGTEVPSNTYEHVIFPQRGIIFAERGDSGALVFTEDHVVVGMVIGGSTAANAFKPAPSFFTRIEDLIADIKLITKATDVRLKVGRS